MPNVKTLSVDELNEYVDVLTDIIDVAGVDPANGDMKEHKLFLSMCVVELASRS